MNKNVSIAIATALVMNSGVANAQEAVNIGKHNITLSKDVMTPETLWASNAHVSLNTVDIGLAQLAMHSSYETAGAKDTEYLVEAMSHFFSLTLEDEGEGVFSLR